MPIAWHLTEIKYPDGKKIIFNYEKEGFNILRQDVKADYEIRVQHYPNNEEWRTPIIDVNVPQTQKLEAQFTVIEPSYIASIVTPYETIKFIRGDDSDLNTSDYNLERDIEYLGADDESSRPEF